MVLSTLHTNDAPSSISRLLNMGIESFLVANSLNLVCAQRLVRRICEKCKVRMEISAPILVEGGYTPEEAAALKPYKGKGCDRCGGTGYKGRVGLFEVMEMSDPLREAVITGASAAEMRRVAISEGMTTLRRSGLMKVADGVTTFEEVVRETM
jgi:type IV pilus assembly protein PilB